MDNIFTFLNKYGWLRFVPIFIFFVILLFFFTFGILAYNTTPKTYKTSNSILIEAKVEEYYEDTKIITISDKDIMYKLYLSYEINNEIYNDTIAYKCKKEDSIPYSIEVYVNNETKLVNQRDTVLGVNKTIVSTIAYTFTFLLNIFVLILFIKNRSYL